MDIEGEGPGDVLVLPAASSPSMSNRISFDPKILLMILEMFPPILSVFYELPPQ